MSAVRLSRNAPLGPFEVARAEGFRFLERAQLELAAGDFDKPGTALFGLVGAEVGVGGLTPDPYPDAAPGIGRLRHLYVLPHYRRQGIKELVTAVLAEARQHYSVVRLRTDTPAAARFYETLGFYAHAEPGATHRLELGCLELGCAG